MISNEQAESWSEEPSRARSQGLRGGLARSLRQSKAPAISRAGAILRLLAVTSNPLGVQAVAHTLGLVPSTCLYILRALVVEGIVSFDTKKKVYSLEASMLVLAQHWLKFDSPSGR